MSPCAALLDLADSGDEIGVERALNEGRERRLITQRDLKRVIDRSPGRAGLPILGPHLAEGIDEDFSRKEGERILWNLIKASGLPRPRRNIRVEGYELDFYWPELRLNVETDGVRWHSSRRKMNSDRERDGTLTVAGIQVLRFTWDQLQHPERVLVRLAAAITLAQHDRRSRVTS